MSELPDSGRARLQVQCALQAVASVASTHLRPLEGARHLACVWLPESGVLASGVHPGARPFRVGLRPADLTLVALDDADNIVDAHPLDQRSHDGALRWIRKVVAAITAGGIDVELAPPPFALPDHPVARGGRYALDPPKAFEALALELAGAHTVLLEAARRLPAEVLCWPDRFVLESSVALAGGALRVGFSPGDARDAAPYWYAIGPTGEQMLKSEGTSRNGAEFLRAALDTSSRGAPG